MSGHIFLTGFPGFIGGRLLAALAERNSARRFSLLVERRLHTMAEQKLAQMGLHDRCELLTGDLVEPDAGIEHAAERLGEVTEVWHLAAIYDLAVARELAHRVNVQGTRNLLDLCEKLPQLQRLVLFSTCYVAGDRTGLVREEELDAGQGFKNHYESTKFESEVLVRGRMETIPATVFRPSIVVGDSKTGETDKYDGPYYFIRLLMRRHLGPLTPMIGPGTATINIVPVDFVVDAAVTIAEQAESVNTTFQLADPRPLTIREMFAAMCAELGLPTPKWSLPVGAARALERFRPVRKWLGVPKEALDYLEHPVTFDTNNTERLLQGTGVTCPQVPSYLGTLIQYVRAHPEKPFLDEREL